MLLHPPIVKRAYSAGDVALDPAVQRWRKSQAKHVALLDWYCTRWCETVTNNEKRQGEHVIDTTRPGSGIMEVAECHADSVDNVAYRTENGGRLVMI